MIQSKYIIPSENSIITKTILICMRVTKVCVMREHSPFSKQENLMKLIIQHYQKFWMKGLCRMKNKNNAQKISPKEQDCDHHHLDSCRKVFKLVILGEVKCQRKILLCINSYIIIMSQRIVLNQWKVTFHQQSAN